MATTAPTRLADRPDRRKAISGLSGLNIALGLWLFISPFVLGITAMEGATLNFLIIGAAIAVMAIVRLMRPLQFEGVSLTNAVLGAWLIIAPFVLGYSAFSTPLWNSIIVGALVLLASGLSIWLSRRMSDRTMTRTPRDERLGSDFDRDRGPGHERGNVYVT